MSARLGNIEQIAGQMEYMDSADNAHGDTNMQAAHKTTKPKATADNASSRAGQRMARAMSFLLLLMLAWAGNSWAATTTTTLSASQNPSIAGQTVTLTATVTGGSVTFGPTGTVDFYDGTAWLGSATFPHTGGNVVTLSPTFTTAGAHSLTAVYAGDANNATSTSAAVVQTVNPAAAQVYYIHADQLNTPREITNASGTLVWQWDNTDPYGNNAANENPAGAGTFSFNLRFPGQYFDKETGLSYNRFRDYDPSIGRYIQSDPIGLGGGVNTYAYVLGNPLLFKDPYGLKTTVELAIEQALARGDAAELEMLLEQGSTTAAERAAIENALREIDILKNALSGESRIAQALNRTREEIKDAIHACKNKMRSKGAKERNPDVIVDQRTGEVYPKFSDGRLGDSWGNIYDYLP